MHRKIALSGLATVAVATGGILTGVSPASASSGGTISVVYQVQGGTNALTALVNTAKTEFQKQYPGWTVNLEPITSPAENEYYTKLDLMNGSASTAPNVMYEDTFLVNSDVAAGYLSPLNSYLSTWSGWKEFSPAAQAAAKGANGKIYGVSMGTDTRGLYYNKQIFAKVGLPVPWHPTSWAQVLAAAETIKAKDPGVTPMNVYGGLGEGEGSTMQGFEMFLYGTNNWLWDSTHAKWEKAGAGFQSALGVYQQIYVKDNLGPTVQTALGSQTWQTVQQGLMPQGKLGIDLDGSWVTSDYIGSGPKPWPQYTKVLGVAPMPTENGQGPGHVSLSGGWLLSVGSHGTSAQKQMAFNYITIALNQKNSLTYDITGGQVASRQDVATAPAYKNQGPLVATFSSFVPFTHFRPAFAAYPKLSTEIQTITGQVMTGQETPAQGAAAYNKYLIATVGASNVENAPA
jgi:multiple sugar transport system substrate-binding protein